MLSRTKKVVPLFVLICLLSLNLIKYGTVNSSTEKKTLTKNSQLRYQELQYQETFGDVQYEKCWNKIMAIKFKYIRKTHVNMNEIRHSINNNCIKTNISCPAPKFKGYIGVNKNISTDLKEAVVSNLNFVYQGGWWVPPNCRLETNTVAIVIPFRDRDEHLPVLLQHLHPILQRQQLHYRFFVIKQDKDYSFNKGMLVNAGVKEILKLYPYDCLVIQDVDLVPEDDRIDYSCKVSPMHLARRIDKFDYKALDLGPFIGNFGGVVSISSKHYIRVNGFSNLFWQWGGEDDNMHERVHMSGLKRKAENLTIARYTMLKHTNRKFLNKKKDWEELGRNMRSGREHWKADGYNSVVYLVNEMRVEDLYTSIEFNLVKESLIP